MPTCASGKACTRCATRCARAPTCASEQARYRWEFQLLAGETADDFATLTALRPLIAPWTVGVADSELTLLRVTEYTFRAQIADRWRRGNVFILGDAAHLTPPFIGQGMGAGLRDAMNLAWKIAGVRNGTLAANVLDTYEQERKPHTRQLIRLALNVGRAMTGGGRLGNAVRRMVLPRVRLLPGLRDKVVDSTTPPLRRFGAGAQVPPAGCSSRARCARIRLLPGGQRLDDVVGAGFALITTRPLGGSRRSSAATGAESSILVADRGTELEKWLRRATCHGRDRAPRPDGHARRARRRRAVRVDRYRPDR